MTEKEQMVEKEHMTEKEQITEKEQMTQEEQLAQAMETLQRYIGRLAERAGESKEYAEELWKRISGSNGLLRELAYYHDFGDFLSEYKVEGYTLMDILVWQVDHFKAYLDRPEEMNRYRQERLLLTSFDVMSKMEENPQPYINKMQGETGTDFVGKF